MMIAPIQVTPEGVLIPLHYLQGAHEFEFEVVDGHVLVRPKTNGQPTSKSWATDKGIGEKEARPASLAEPAPRYSWIGIAHSGNPDASVEVEKILAEEIDDRAGWTLKR